MEFPNKNLRPLHFVDEVTELAPGASGGTVTKRVAKLFIWGPIGGWWGVWGEDVFFSLLGQEVDRIDVYVSSGGGGIVEAFEIYNQLVGHKAPVNVYIFGIAASAATIVSLSGDRVFMSEQSMFMIHQAAVWLGGMYHADELESEARALRKFTNRITSLYEKKTELPRDLLEEMMGRDEWFEPEEALAAGFITDVVEVIEIPFDLSGISEEQFQEDFEIHTADYARKILMKSGYVQASFTPGEKTRPESSNNFTNMFKSFIAWASGLGISLTNSSGDILDDAKFEELAKGKEDGLMAILQPKAEQHAQDLVTSAMAGFQEEVDGKIAKLQETTEENSKLRNEVKDLKKKVATLMSGGTQTAKNNNGGGPLLDNDDKDTDKEPLAFGQGSKTFGVLASAKMIDAKAISDLEAKVAQKRAEAGK